jgi:hypothetical protein
VAITHVDSNTQTVGSGTSVTVTKPTGTVLDDLLLAFFTSNNQDCTPPTGWTELADETIEVFRCQVFYKVATGSEPSNYQFSVGSNAPLVCTVSALRDVDKTTPIDISPTVGTDTSHSEAYTTPSLTGGTSGRLIYFRTVRFSGTTPPTFTASSVSEMSDVGVFSGGSVCYSQGLYMATSDYSGSGSKSGLGITCSSSESHNFVLTMGVKAKSGATGTADAVMPSLPSVSMAGYWSDHGVVDVDIPMPTADVSAFSGAYEAELDVDVPISVDVAGNTPVRGSLDVIPTPEVEVVGETRFFGGNSITPEREERWFVITQDGYYLGVRTGVNVPLTIEMSLPVVSFLLHTHPHAPDAEVVASANGAVFALTSFATSETGAISATASSPTVLLGDFGAPDELNIPVTVDDASVSITFPAEDTSAVGVAEDITGFTVAVVDAVIAAATYDPVVSIKTPPVAETGAISVVAYDILFQARGGHVTVAAQTYDPSIRIKSNAGTALATCHN